MLLQLSYYHMYPVVFAQCFGFASAFCDWYHLALGLASKLSSGNYYFSYLSLIFIPYRELFNLPEDNTTYAEGT